MRRSSVLAVVALLAVAAAPPRPATVEDAAERDGQLRLHPPVLVVDVAPGGTHLPLTLRNGSDQTVQVELSVVAVELDAAGAPRPTERSDGDATRVTFAEPSITLPPGTQARFAPAVSGTTDAGATALIAIRARSTSGETVLSLVALDRPASRPEVTLAVQLERDGSRSSVLTTVANTGTGSALVALRTVLASWSGRALFDDTVSPLLVPPGATRAVTTAFRTPTLPAPLTATAVATTRDGDTTEAAQRTVLWNPTAALLLLALASVVVTAWTWWRVRRRAARGSDAPRASAPHE